MIKCFKCSFLFLGMLPTVGLVAQDSISDWNVFEYEAVALQNKLVREELELSDEQAAELKGIYLDRLGKLHFLKSVKLRKTVEGSEEYDALIEEGDKMIKEARLEFRSIVLDFQDKKLSEIARQSYHFDRNGLYIKSIQKGLGLSKEQIKNLEKVNETFVDEVEELRSEFSKKVTRVVKRNMKEMKDELSASQKKTFDSYFGEPFFPAFQKLWMR